jgi:arylformamidase
VLIDVTLPIRTDMIVYEGDPGVEIRPYRRIARGDPANVSLLALGSHTGTHLDAPAHFLEGAPALEAIPLDALVGPVRVAEVAAAPLIRRADLERLPLDGHRRLVLKTSNSARWARGRFDRDYVALDLDAARLVTEAGLRLIGIDYLSIEAFHAPGHPVHKHLLGHGVVVLEGLDLSRVAPGDYELLCLPLAVPGLDGAPCRVLLRA